MLDKCGLYGMEMAVLGQAFDRRYFVSLGIGRQNHAGIDWCPVESNCACAARAAIARNLGAREIKPFPQHLG